MQELAKDIILRAASGDRQAFQDIYKRYSALVYNVAFRFSNNPQDAQEITQDVFLAVYRKLKSFGFRSSLKTWIYRITVNMSLNHRKKRSRYRDRELPLEEEYYVSDQGAKDIRETEEDARFFVKKLFSVLSDEQRECMMLRHVEQMSYEEIARALGLNINTVRTRLKRAREKLVVLKKEVISHEL